MVGVIYSETIQSYLHVLSFQPSHTVLLWLLIPRIYSYHPTSRGKVSYCQGSWSFMAGMGICYVWHLLNGIHVHMGDLAHEACGLVIVKIYVCILLYSVSYA